MKLTALKNKLQLLVFVTITSFLCAPLIALGLEFESMSINNDQGDSRQAFFADFNNNGLLDIYVADRNSDTNLNQNILWINNGDGTFTDNSISMMNNTILGGVNVNDDKYFSFGASIADFNNNGLLDIYVVNDGAPNRLWLNRGDVNGDGLIQFENADIPGDAVNFSRASTVGDFNGNGYIDIYTAQQSGQNRLWLNNGDETFISADIPGDNLGSSRRPFAADINGNGNVDIIVTRSGQRNYILYNNGDAQFVIDDTFSNLTDSSREFAVADFNGNGFLDIYVANMFDQPNRLLINNGDGTFTQSDIMDDLGDSWGVSSVDINNSGRKDIIVANRNQKNTIWINEGDMIFSRYEIEGDNQYSSRSIAVGDVNNNGYVDIYIANGEGDQNELWLQVAPFAPVAPSTSSPRRRSATRLTSEQLAQMGIVINVQEKQAEYQDRNTQIMQLINSLEKGYDGKVTQKGFIQFIMGLVQILN